MEDKPIISPLSEFEATFEVYAVAVYYPQFIKVFVPKVKYTKLKEGMEHRKLKVSMPNAKELIEEVFEEKRKKDKEDNLTRSLRRTKRAVKDYVLCNQFELFATFTFAKERQDVERCRARMSNWLKNEQKRKGKFEYLIVAERHKDGALHFHALIKGYNGRVEQAKHPKTGEPIVQKGRIVYALPSWTAGFTNVKRVDEQPDSHAKVANYVTKYITKDMPLFANRNRYWASFGLKLPLIVYNPPPWYMEEPAEWQKDFDFGTLYHFPYKSERDELGDVVSLMEGKKA